jgi:anti-sigma factor RsiW
MQERDVGGLRCSEVLARLSDYIDGAVDASTLAQIEAHLAGCTLCERFGKDFGEMVVAVRRHADEEGPLEAALVDRILEAVREGD